MPTLRCCPAPGALVRLLDGALPDAEASALEAHLAECGDCQAAVAAALAPPGDSGLVPGARIAERFELETAIGTGAHGCVFQALDTTLGRKVALKLLREPLRDQEHAVHRLFREARLLARLTDPHVMRVYDVGLHEGCPFLVTELLSGGDLLSWLATQPRSASEILAVFVGAAQGLHAAHRLGVVHRDFKPSNLLVDDGGRACVADFGLARLEHEAGSANAPSALALLPLSRSGTVAGTPAYLAPEVLRGEEATPLSDQFSYFVSLYEAFEGERPFPVPLAQRGPRRPFSARTPRAIRALIDRGLAESPEARFPDMGAVQAALSAALRRRSRGRLAGVGAGVLAVLLAALLGTMLPRVRDGLACAREASELAWPATERDALLAAFGAGPTTTTERATRVRQRLLAFAAQWEETFRAACTSARGTGSVDGWPARRECLRRQAQFVRTVSQSLTPLAAAPEGTLEEQLADLPRPSDCDAAETRAPRPGELGRLALAGLEVARLEALRSSGEHRRAVVEAEALRRFAQHEGFRELDAEAALHLAQALYFVNEEQRALDLFQEVVLDADRLGLDGIRLQALNGAAFLQGARFGRFEEALRTMAAAEALAARLGASPASLEELAYTKGTLLFHQGRRAESIRELERTLSLVEAHRGRPTPLYVHALLLLARAHQWEQRTERAIGYYEQARVLAAEVASPRSLLYASATNDLGTALADRGRLRDALKVLEECLALQRALSPEPTLNLLIAQQHVGSLQLEVGSAVEGAALLEETLRTYGSRFADREGMTLPVLRGLVRASVLAEDPGAIRAWSERLERVATRSYAEGNPRRISALCSRGHALLGLKTPETARKLFAQARRERGEGHADAAEDWCLDAGELLASGALEPLASSLLRRTGAADTLAARLYRAAAHAARARRALELGDGRAARRSSAEGLAELEGLEGRSVGQARRVLESLGAGTRTTTPLAGLF